MNKSFSNFPKISDYILIGNSRTAALVCKTGAIEWCCFPEFDSSSIFASILDRKKGGYFSLSSVSDFESRQQYLEDTNVAETTFKTEDAEYRLLDTFTVMTDEEKTKNIFPEHEILRIIEGVKGNARVRMEFLPRIYYGKHTPKLQDRKKLGIHFSWKGHIYHLLSTLESSQIQIDSKKGKAYAEFDLKAGDQILFSLSYSSQSPAVIPELHLTGRDRMEKSIAYWRKWIQKCQYTGIYQNHVRRSALLLKLLSYAPSGAIIAAPTTSLPEEIGGVRNWDYRYCWLRDASLTVQALLSLHLEEEVRAYMNWIIHATRLTRPKLQVVYTVFGNTNLQEKTLDWLEGYQNSKPVRIGNDADGQFQLDLYGEVMDAIFSFSSLVEKFDNSTRKFVLGIGKAIEELWDQPDEGIWEIRSKRVHHTHSKVMAWVGLDRLIKLSEKYHWKEVPLEKYQKLAAEIRGKIEEEGFNEKFNSYTCELKGSTLDASLLTLSLHGYCEADHPKMMSTCKAIYKNLSKNNLIYRYDKIDDGVAGGEGTFGACTFWLIENLAKSGELEKATEILEGILKKSNPSGLFSEEIDPDTSELLGNFPQGFTHIGLINAVLAVNKASQK